MALGVSHNSRSHWTANKVLAREWERGANRVIVREWESGDQIGL